MTWFKRKKPKKSAVLINPHGLIRNVIYDAMMPDPEHIALAVGLAPLSADVAEMEEEASEKRLNRVAALLPLLENHAVIAGKVTAMNYAISKEFDPIDSELTDEMLEALSSMFGYVSFISTVSFLTQCVDLGLIEVAHGK